MIIDSSGNLLRIITDKYANVQLLLNQQQLSLCEVLPYNQNKNASAANTILFNEARTILLLNLATGFGLTNVLLNILFMILLLRLVLFQMELI